MINDTFAMFDTKTTNATTLLNAMPHGVDTSHWNNQANYKRYSDGADFVIYKATEGERYKDLTSIERARLMKKPTALYHYLKPTANITLQVLNFYEVYRQLLFEKMSHFNGGFYTSIIPVLDWEEGTTAELLEFVKQWEKVSNVPLTIYCSWGWFEPYKLYLNTSLTRCYFWVAGYTDNHDKIINRINTSNRVILYQYASHNLNDKIDLDVYRFDISYWGLYFVNKSWYYAHERELLKEFL